MLTIILNKKHIRVPGLRKHDGQHRIGLLRPHIFTQEGLSALSNHSNARQLSTPTTETQPQCDGTYKPRAILAARPQPFEASTYNAAVPPTLQPEPPTVQCPQRPVNPQRVIRRTVTSTAPMTDKQSETPHQAYCEPRNHRANGELPFLLRHWINRKRQSTSPTRHDLRRRKRNEALHMHTSTASTNTSFAISEKLEQ
ncbi:hypothetical protein NP233_g12144 [Leucocoprinus birnbaumii]|uniref:Uncharacterized protein n=1 Tax=Leucocoprinus birnbaumii TaxID=56174 RepID=A0AAD5YQA2_9AGAR|nr:hypothetical protein NP233_g12144 [Leucocoprinus birnbaumii]